jgi:6-phosphogluconolactonase (cycloisomerase 2 family)
VLLNGCGNFFTKQTTGTGGGGGGNAPTNPNAGDVFYFANPEASTVSGYTVSSTGVLAAVTDSPYTLGSAPTAMAITPGDTFLYVAEAGGIFGYSIGTAGVLTALNSGNELADDQLAVPTMQVDTTGNYLLAASLSAATGLPEVGVYAIDTSSGGLTLQGNLLSLTQSGNGSTSTSPANTPNELYIAPNDQFVYLTLGSGGTELFSFDESSGSISTGNTYQNLASSGTGQVGVAANPNSTVLYISETGTGVRAFLINSASSLTELTGSPFKAGTGPSALALDSTGAHLYVTNKGDGTITGYAIGTSGGLTALGTSPYAAGAEPLSLALDSTGSFLAVANSTGTPDYDIYSFDTSTLGKLDSVTNSVDTNVAGNALVVGTHAVN